MASNSEFHIVVVGGGIGGVATAMGLAAKGFKVTILEQAAEFGEIGAGIQLGPNAFHAMDYLGVGEIARGIAIYIDRLVMMDSVDGAEIAAIPLQEAFRERFGNPYAVIHRADLHGIFADACAGHENVTMLTSQTVVGYENLGQAAQVVTDSGQVFSGDAVIACDGIHSRLREQMTGGEQAGDVLKLSSHVCYRAVLPIEEMPEDLRWNAATLWAGPRCHLVHYPLQGWKSFNIVATFHADTSQLDVDIPGTKEEVLENFSHVSDKPMSIIRRPESWKRWVLGDREPIENWTDGRVTLLGDAAHPTHQYYAQGACMAMEDAVCLTHQLARCQGDIESAFRAYQDQRMTRAYRVVLTSREIGKHMYHASGMHRQIRNEIMRAKSAEDWYQTVQWLYGGTGLSSSMAA